MQENVEEAGVRTYKKIRRPEFRPELEQRRKWECGKDKGRNTDIEPHWRRDGHSCCPVSPPIDDIWGVLKQEVYKEGWDPKMKRF